MEWLIQASHRGRRIEQHDKIWIVVRCLGDDLYLVVEEGSTLPADVKIIKEIKKET